SGGPGGECPCCPRGVRWKKSQKTRRSRPCALPATRVESSRRGRRTGAEPRPRTQRDRTAPRRVAVRRPARRSRRQSDRQSRAAGVERRRDTGAPRATAASCHTRIAKDPLASGNAHHACEPRELDLEQASAERSHSVVATALVVIGTPPSRRFIDET